MIVVSLELVDPQQGVPLQVWTLEGADQWQIGRSDSCDIVISSPFVSRVHALLRCVDDAWELTGLSEKGLLLDGERCTTITLADGTEFRLAAKGPLLRFRQHQSERSDPTTACMATMNFDSDSMPMLIIDIEQRNREVDDIVSDEYFRSVQKMAKRMKQDRRPAKQD
ncbi:MAG: FHA domain-containing protein [Planctomycetaceae bacterium]|nr:FHA domain-containing protein [Planctomycetaceae bacterium]